MHIFSALVRTRGGRTQSFSSGFGRKVVGGSDSSAAFKRIESALIVVVATE